LASKSGPEFSPSAAAARYFTDGSPDSERLATMHAVHQWESWSTLTECVRSGSRVERSVTEARGRDWTEAFIEAMAKTGSERAPHVVAAVGAAGVKRMLDVGGGPGSYSIAFAEAHPELRADILDKSEVLEIARRHIERAGLSSRVNTVPGDLTASDFGSGYDLALISNICHMLGPEANRDLLKRAAKALAPGGRVVIQDFVLDENRTSPPAAALFALNMLVATEHGASYTTGEYEDWLRGAGLTGARKAGLPGRTDLIIASLPDGNQ